MPKPMQEKLQLTYKTKHFFFVLIKLSIVFGTVYFIYTKLTTNKELDFDIFIELISQNNIVSITSIGVLLTLTFINWGLEIYKWKTLVSYITPLSFFEATKQSLAALTASLFTPNRIGDYAAKTVYFRSPLRKRVLLLNLLSNMAQMFTTILFGVVGLVFFFNTYKVDFSLYKLLYLLLIVIAIAAFSRFLFFRKNINIRGFSIDKIRKFIKQMPYRLHFKNFGFSLLRYLVFSFQFYYLLYLFHIDLNYMEAMTLITSMYLLASVVPSIFIFDVVIKGGVAVYLFSFANVNSLTVLCITTLMWIFNFVLPSIPGSYFVLNFKLPTINNDPLN